MRRKNKVSWPISRVLSWTTIHLGCLSPNTSSNLPDLNAGRAKEVLFGLAPSGVCRAGLLPDSRCALTAPFHPCRYQRTDTWAVSFCCTFRRLAPPRRYLALCPVEPGLSSINTRLTAVVWPTHSAGYRAALTLAIRACASSMLYNTLGTCPHTGLGQHASPSWRTM